MERLTNIINELWGLWMLNNDFHKLRSRIAQKSFLDKEKSDNWTCWTPPSPSKVIKITYFEGFRYTCLPTDEYSAKKV